MLKKGISYFDITLGVLTIILLALPLFRNLGALPMRSWDESNLAINAYNMYKNHNYLVTYFNGEPDLWNTKPPLMIWMQCLGMNVFSDVEFALRFPSAMAALLLVVVFLLFSYVHFGNIYFGVMAAVSTITADGFVSHHTARTGDYDSLLTTLSITYLLLFYLFIHRKENKYLILFFVFLSLAVLCKSIAGLFFIPFLIFYSISKQSFFPLFKNKFFYIGVSFFLITVGGFYISRELAASGYLSAWIQNDIGLKGRFFVQGNYEASSEWYYVKQLISSQFSYWIWIVPMGILTVFFHKKLTSLVWYIVGNLLFFLLIISLSKTKFYWYDMPCIPLLGMLVAIFFYALYEWFIASLLIKNKIIATVIVLLLFIIISIKPYKSLWLKTNQVIDNINIQVYDIPFTYFFHNAIQDNNIQKLNGYKLLVNDYFSRWFFMYYEIIRDKGVDIELCNIEQIKRGDKILYCEPEIELQLKRLKLNFEIKKIELNFKFATVE